MRDHVIREITEMAKKNPDIFLLTGDLGYVVLDEYIEKCPNQYFNMGIAEQNMASVAAGMALEGNTVFTYSIGNFPTLRCIEQIRNDICYHRANVKILAVGGGFVYGNQGITHHATEDLSFMRTLPNMRVYVPGDAYEAIACLDDAVAYNGPCYIRLARNKEECFHRNNENININKIVCFDDINNDYDVAILTTGSILCEGIKLRKQLKELDYSAALFSVPRIKPVDSEGIECIVKKSKIVITIEEHQLTGGLSGVCSEVISRIDSPHAIMRSFGLNNEFSGITGSQEYLRNYYGLTASKIFESLELNKKCRELK